MTRHRRLVLSGILVSLVAVGWPATRSIFGQATPAVAKAWTPQRTPWGEPDLQGLWTNFDETPFESPNPDAAAAAIERAIVNQRYAGVGDIPNQWAGHKSPISPRRPSLVVDPPNGRIPVVPGASTYRNYDLLGDSWEFDIPSERCVTRGVPAVMYPAGYNNGHQILQTPGYVTIHSEMIHDARIIPVDGRPHVSKDIRLWNGDSRGRWEGDTLVVDTTNFNKKGVVRASAAVVIPQSEGLHVVERFTRIGENTMSYSATIEDPHVFTRSWTVTLPLNIDPSYRIYEYACHEGNRDYIENSLRGGRALDKAGAVRSKKIRD